MATDVERLVVSLEASITKYERAMQRAIGQTNQTARNMENRFNQAAQKVETRFQRMGRGVTAGIAGLQAGMAGARGILGVAGIGLGAAQIANLTSEWSDLNSRVNNAVGSMSRGSEVMGRITEMARRTYSSLTQTAEGFLQNADALNELGYNTTQQLNMTEALNNALVISATRGQQAEAVMRAWSQALALGGLRGDNLNTIIQNSSRLTRALADSMGVSVNSLRTLGTAGQITARDMMGITRELEELRAEADAMPATLADSFVLFGNAVMQFVGQFDQATGLTSTLAAEIIQLADDIEAAAQRWENRDVPILRLVDAAAELSRELGILRQATEDTRSDMERAEDAVATARLAFADLADQMQRNENMRAFAPHLPDEIQAIVDKLLLNEISAEDARAALLALGQANLDFSAQIGQLAGLAGQLRTVADEARAMHAALNTAGGPTGDGAGRGGAGASRRARIEREEALATYTTERERVLGLSREQLDLETAIAREIENAAKAGVQLSQAEAERLARLQLSQREANRSGRGRSGGRGGANDFANETAEMERRTQALIRETALMATLNPLVDDYGYALAKVRAQMELENAAAKADLALTPERIAQIDQLAEGYASATAEAERLAEAQDRARQNAEELGRIGQQALMGIVDGFLAGRDAGSILLDMLNQIGRQLLSMGVNSLFGAGGLNPLGFLSGIIPGFSSGTANTGGARGQVRGVVHGQEAVIPLPNGGRVPVQITAPNMPAAVPQKLTVHVSLDDDMLRAVVRDQAGRTVAQAAPTIIAASTNQAGKAAPGAMASFQRDIAGGDWR